MKRIKVVIGSNFGDEGKGLMTNYFAQQMMKESGKCLVVLSNGGAQRGHTVMTENGVRHVFRHFGSGTFAGADTYCPAPFIVNPMVFMKEYHELKEQGAPLDRIRVYVHPDCLVTTPFEMITNLALEEHRGDARHGSVGIGIWETVIGNGKKFGELSDLNDADVYRYLDQDRREHQKKRLKEQGLAAIPGTWRDVLNDLGLLEHYMADLREMQKLVIRTEDTLLYEYDDIIFENGQGLLLDRSMKWKGYGEHTTPSNTGIKNPAQMIAKIMGQSVREPVKGETCEDSIDLEAVYVTRTYMTRHGAGRFDTECPKEMIGSGIKDFTNMPNDSQGTLRYGRLNFRSLVKRVKRDFKELDRYIDRSAGGMPDKDIIDRSADGMYEKTIDRSAGRIHAKMAIAVTHMNEYPLPEIRSGYIKYKSGSETGEKYVIMG